MNSFRFHYSTVSSYFIYDCIWEQLITLNKLCYSSVFRHSLSLNYWANLIIDSKKYLLNKETQWEWKGERNRETEREKLRPRKREQKRQRQKYSKRNNFIKIWKRVRSLHNCLNCRLCHILPMLALGHSFPHAVDQIQNIMMTYHSVTTSWRSPCLSLLD